MADVPRGSNPIVTELLGRMSERVGKAESNLGLVREGRQVAEDARKLREAEALASSRKLKPSPNRKF